MQVGEEADPVKDKDLCVAQAQVLVYLLYSYKSTNTEPQELRARYSSRNPKQSTYADVC
jgi:hypothetical protein